VSEVSIDNKRKLKNIAGKNLPFFVLTCVFTLQTVKSRILFVNYGIAQQRRSSQGKCNQMLRPTALPWTELRSIPHVNSSTNKWTRHSGGENSSEIHRVAYEFKNLILKIIEIKKWVQLSGKTIILSSFQSMCTNKDTTHKQ
jgi:hypothetical protein